jgi:HD-GYP domain-containing protein (c-di-GMP phosphodiesterase class II)
LVWQHHERVDGKGYPRGLHGSEIHPLARVLAVADVYDALRSERPYRRALEVDEVAKHLKENSGQQFDAAVVQVFLRVLAALDAEVKDAADASGRLPVEAAG